MSRVETPPCAVGRGGDVVPEGAATRGRPPPLRAMAGRLGKISKRYFFLIDREGIVRGKWLGEDLAVFPTEVLLKAARDLAAQR